jgi:hypothetical protein
VKMVAFPYPAPGGWTLLTGARGPQGASVRPRSGWYTYVYRGAVPGGKGVNYCYSIYMLLLQYLLYTESETVFFSYLIIPPWMKVLYVESANLLDNVVAQSLVSLRIATRILAIILWR